MSPTELNEFLEKLINSSLKKSIMIWGAPGIGKSSIVSSIAIKLNLEFIDLRLSQLAPTDLRGLPVPIHTSEKENACQDMVLAHHSRPRGVVPMLYAAGVFGGIVKPYPPPAGAINKLRRNHHTHLRNREVGLVPIWA